MKKEMIRRKSAVSTFTALFTVLMMTAVMTFAGTFAVFADDTVPDQGQAVDKIRDVSKKQEITFRDPEASGKGAPPNVNIPPLPGHGPSGNYDDEPDDPGNGDSSDENNKNKKDDDSKSPDLSDFGSGGGNMYPFNDPNPDNNDPDDDPNSPGSDSNGDDSEIDNYFDDEINADPFEENQLNSTPQTEEADKKPSDPEKDKVDDPKNEYPANNERGQPGKDTVPDKGTEQDPGSSDNTVTGVPEKTSDISDNDKDKSGADKTADPSITADPENKDPVNIEKDQPEKDTVPDKGAEKDPVSNDNAVIRVSDKDPETNDNTVTSVSDKTADTSDSDKDNSGTDKTKGSGSTGISAASAVRAGAGSPQTGDSNGLGDAVTLFILSIACLTAMMHSRRNKET